MSSSDKNMILLYISEFYTAIRVIVSARIELRLAEAEVLVFHLRLLLSHDSSNLESQRASITGLTAGCTLCTERPYVRRSALPFFNLISPANP